MRRFDRNIGMSIHKSMGIDIFRYERIIKQSEVPLHTEYLTNMRLKGGNVDSIIANKSLGSLNNVSIEGIEGDDLHSRKYLENNHSTGSYLQH